MQSNDRHNGSLPWTIAIVLALVCLYLFAMRPGVLDTIQARFHLTPAPGTSAPETSLGDQIREGAAPPPVLSQEVSASLEQSGGFQALVSFTDAGFEPASLTVQAGDTVRFTNNSSESLRIRGADASGMDAAGAACEAESFDSCRALAPQEFWEHTFMAGGTVQYGNESGTRTGVVTVE